MMRTQDVHDLTRHDEPRGRHLSVRPTPCAFPIQAQISLQHYPGLSHHASNGSLLHPIPNRLGGLFRSDFFFFNFPKHSFRKPQGSHKAMKLHSLLSPLLVILNR